MRSGGDRQTDFDIKRLKRRREQLEGAVLARIRTIKPEFWHNVKVGQVTRDARLFFIGLWNFADDWGRIGGVPRVLRGLLFPFDDDIQIEPILDELEKVGLIQRYLVGGKPFTQVVSFSKHQKIDKRSKSWIPGPESADPAQSPPNSHAIQAESAFEKREMGVGSQSQSQSQSLKTCGLPPKSADPADVAPRVENKKPEKPKREKAEAPPNPRHALMVARLCATYERVRQAPYAFSGHDAKCVSELLGISGDDAEIDARWERGLRTEFKNRCDTLANLTRNWNGLTAFSTGPPDVRKGTVRAEDFAHLHGPPGDVNF